MNPVNKLDEYIQNESQSQFSDEKREEIEETRLGRSKLSPSVQMEYELALKKARMKSESAYLCAWCQNEPVVVRNSREIVHLCSHCEDGRPVIEQFMTANKKGHLTDADRILIKKRGVTRLGGGFRPRYD